MGRPGLSTGPGRAHLTFLYEDCLAGVAALEHCESVAAVSHGTFLKTVAAVYDRRLWENRRSQSVATAKPYHCPAADRVVAPLQRGYVPPAIQAAKMAVLPLQRPGQRGCKKLRCARHGRNYPPVLGSLADAGVAVAPGSNWAYEATITPRTANRQPSGYRTKP